MEDSDSKQPCLSDDIQRAWASVEAEARLETFEDGINHPAELAFKRFLSQYGDDCLIQLMAQTSRFALMLRLAGRMRAIGLDVRVALVKKGLSSASFDTRDAAIQAIETWEDTAFIPILQDHVEPDAWLSEYIGRLISDLQNDQIATLREFERSWAFLYVVMTAVAVCLILSVGVVVALLAVMSWVYLIGVLSLGIGLMFGAIRVILLPRKFQRPPFLYVAPFVLGASYTCLFFSYPLYLWRKVRKRYAR